MKRGLNKGWIVGVSLDSESGVGFIGLIDDDKGKIIAPCRAEDLVRSFRNKFGVDLPEGFSDGGIAGKEILYSLDEEGHFTGFTTVAPSPPEAAPADL